MTDAELEQLNRQKNTIKEPYEMNQVNFENFFCSYYVIVSYFFDQDREAQTNSNLMSVIAKNQKKVMQLVCEGIQNPVVASALH